MQIDHLFIFSPINGEEANELVDFGLVEGSHRIHPGQGTRNRKFYFDNFFLEIVWVHDEEEIRRPATVEAGLWQRAQFMDNGSSPFGMALVDSGDGDVLFSRAHIYEPQFFDKGVEVLPHEDRPYLPWMFRQNYSGAYYAGEPKDHMPPLHQLTKATFGIPDVAKAMDIIRHFDGSNQIDFEAHKQQHLTLEFDSAGSCESHTFTRLPLTLRY